MTSDQESLSDEEPDSEMLSDDLCMQDSDDDSRTLPGNTHQVIIQLV